ncbi:LysR family transcriptional regulator [Actinomadura decatromicini]|uniref:LysR family transcriptional regulator n=1 Tax=Actinomadura decatromicini TaxID=2604572 RepID=A0A5D3FD57_9ACTN|nr:LysR family transcriptional regulator [Actinomadura decatromicini]TYK46827.1 LysR family transcriptional regulator [Actinomadura decatromicini]
MQLELHHLRTLRAVSAAGSLNRAAEQLQLPQPALSRQLRRLEDLFGGSLFDRHPGGVRPTALGRVVLHHAAAILDDCAAIHDDLARHRDRQTGTIRLGWTASCLADLLLDELRRRFPGTAIEVTVGDSIRQVTDWLLAGEIDVALVNEQTVMPGCRPGGLAVQHVIDERPHILLRGDHPLARRPAVTVPELRDERWIAISGSDGCIAFLHRVCRPFGFTPEIVHHLPLHGPHEDVVRHDGSVLLTQGWRPSAPGTVRRPIAGLPWVSRHCLMYRPDGLWARQVPHFARALREAHKARIDAGPRAASG